MQFLRSHIIIILSLWVYISLRKTQNSRYIAKMGTLSSEAWYWNTSCLRLIRGFAGEHNAMQKKRHKEVSMRYTELFIGAIVVTLAKRSIHIPLKRFASALYPRTRRICYSLLRVLSWCPLLSFFNACRTECVIRITLIPLLYKQTRLQKLSKKRKNHNDLLNANRDALSNVLIAI